MPILRKLELKDAEKMLSWMHDDSVTRCFNKNFNSMNIDSCIKFINNTNENFVNDLHMAICDDNNEYCGTVSLKNIDNKLHCAEFAIVLCKDAQGKNLAKFAYDEIVKIGKNDFNLSFIYFSCMKDNIAANKFYRKLNVNTVDYLKLVNTFNVDLSEYDDICISNLIWYIVDLSFVYYDEKIIVTNNLINEYSSQIKNLKMYENSNYAYILGHCMIKYKKIAYFLLDTSWGCIKLVDNTNSHRIINFELYNRTEKYIYIVDIQISDINNGVGTLLMNCLIMYAKELNCKYICGKLMKYDMSDHKEKLLHFYNKFGFDIIKYNDEYKIKLLLN